jgi:hypothetical protein
VRPRNLWPDQNQHAKMSLSGKAQIKRHGHERYEYQRR